ncbi:unnamed protein product [Rhizophagus irregularis]|nr:unnamed protein product [Rhizophagus irregularis]
MKRSNDVFNLQNYKAKAEPISDDFNSLVEQLVAKKTSEDRSAINNIMIIDPLLLPSTSSNSTHTNVDYVYSRLQSRYKYTLRKTIFRTTQTTRRLITPPLSNDDFSSKRKTFQTSCYQKCKYIGESTQALPSVGHLLSPEHK